MMILSKKVLFFVMVLATMFLCGCSSDKNLKQEIGKILKENPEILAEAIKAHPAEFMGAVQEAAKAAREVMAKKHEEAEKKKLEQAYDNPLKPDLNSKMMIRGSKDAPLVLVEYSDFECPYCSRGYETVMQLLKKYKGKIQFIYKHLPLSFHKQAKLASQYYEAIGLQSKEKAFKFHDELYKNQQKIRGGGKKFFNSIAKKVGANLKRLKKELNSKAVLKRISDDLTEAAKLGFQGTPGFILNGVPVRGALPVGHFDNIISELKKRGKVKL